MTNEIPAVKMIPHTIPKVLQIVGETEGDVGEMKRQIAIYLQNESLRRRKPSERILFYAVTVPTLRKLDLIEGEGTQLRSNENGRRLMDAYLSEGVVGFQKELACLLLRLDRIDDRGLVDLIFDLQTEGKNVTLEKLAQELRDRWSEMNNFLNRIDRWLGYLRYADLIIKDGGRISVNQAQISACEMGTSGTEISEGEFSAVLKEEYRKIKASGKGLTHVPIPMIRNAVQRRFKSKGMWSWDFDALLARIPKETDRYILQLSPPMVREEGGLELNKRYYYYLSIYEK